MRVVGEGPNRGLLPVQVRQAGGWVVQPGSLCVLVVFDRQHPVLLGGRLGGASGCRLRSACSDVPPPTPTSLELTRSLPSYATRLTWRDVRPLRANTGLMQPESRCREQNRTVQSGCPIPITVAGAAPWEEDPER